MKKIFTIILLALLALACQKEDMAIEEGRDCLVTFNTVGEITISEEELTRGSASLNDLYVVQVYKGGEPFAMGIFDDVSKMQLNLKTGSTYDIRMAMVRDAKSHLSDYFSLTNNGVLVNKQYSSDPPINYVGPFFYFYFKYISSSNYNYNRYEQCWGYSSSNWYFCTNKFFYNSNNCLHYYYGVDATAVRSFSYDSAFEFKSIREGSLKEVRYPTCTDWFYGEVNKYTPTGEVATLDFVLKRTGFRLKYELSGVTDGEVTVQIYNDTRTFIENTTATTSYESEEQFIAFYDTYNAWLYADNYTENMTVKLTWKRGIGVTQDLGTKTIQVKRNCLNNVRITLSSDDKGAGVTLQTEDEASMGKVDTTIPVA